jgi:uncharacterized protein
MRSALAMSDSGPRRYVDANVIIRFIQNDPAYKEDIQRLLDLAAAGVFVVTVAAVTLVEVTRSPGLPVDSARIPIIASFFENEYILVRDIDRSLASRAVVLIQNHAWLHPIDALHVAAAIDTGCDTFYTFDEELIRRLDGLYGLRFMRP